MAKGPFPIPSTDAGSVEDDNRTISPKAIAEYFRAVPLASFGFKDKIMLPQLKGRSVLLVLEGARHFRAPSGLGGALYEGCAIAIFSDDLGEGAKALINANRESTPKSGGVAAPSVAIFRERLENDTWTFFVTLPNSRTLVVATDRDYLDEVLSRMKGKSGPRALPDSLPEWKYLDTTSQVWGLRHFDRSQANKDPSSPFVFHMLAPRADPMAIGLTFTFDPARGREATITYLSGDEGLGKSPDATPLGLMHSPDAEGVLIKYQVLAPGIVRGSYTLHTPDQIYIFLFFLSSMLGHVVYL